MNELNHNAGKGDKERSPGWRKNYDEINFPEKHAYQNQGFKRIGPNRIRKVYGQRAGGGVSMENWDSGEVECHCGTAHSICECDEREAATRAFDSGFGKAERDLPAVSPDQNGDSCGNHCRCGRRD